MPPPHLGVADVVGDSGSASDGGGGGRRLNKGVGSACRDGIGCAQAHSQTFPVVRVCCPPRPGPAYGPVHLQHLVCSGCGWLPSIRRS